MQYEELSDYQKLFFADYVAVLAKDKELIEHAISYAAKAEGHHDGSVSEVGTDCTGRT